MVDTTAIDLFLGLDLGKEFHHAHGRTQDGRTVHDKRLPNTEPKLLELFTRLVAKFGAVLVIVDQVANIGALPLTVARAAGCRVAYLPGLSMRRAADLHPGETKTDVRDAFVIAETARTMPHTLRAVDRDGVAREASITSFLYSAAELRTLFEAAGFTDVRCYGDFDGGPYDNHARRLIVRGTRPELSADTREL